MGIETFVYAVDDDQDILDHIQALMEAHELPVKCFSDSEAFLKALPYSATGCALLDIDMPGVDGLEVQLRLKEKAPSLPVVFVTGHGDVPKAVLALKQGAVDFIEKPYEAAHLIATVQKCLALQERKSGSMLTKATVASRFEQLTTRERDVMELVVKGEPNKIVAYELGISPRTVEIHRATIMKKMMANSLPDLVRMAITLESPSEG